MQQLLNEGKIFYAGMKNDWEDTSIEVTQEMIDKKLINNLDGSLKDTPVISFDNKNFIDAFNEEYIYLWFVLDENNKKVSKGFTTKETASLELGSTKYDLTKFHRIGQFNDDGTLKS